MKYIHVFIFNVRELNQVNRMHDQFQICAEETHKNDSISNVKEHNKIKIICDYFQVFAEGKYLYVFISIALESIIKLMRHRFLIFTEEQYNASSLSNMCRRTT